jgi:HPt (histidine-containing phosphotransfer) domain-containing protein
MTGEGRVPFDPAAFHRQVGGDRALAVEILHMFLEDCPVRMAAIRAAVERADAKDIQTTAHALKGASLYLTAVFVVEAAARLERIGREERVAEAAAALEQLDAAVAQVMPELRRAALEP